MELAEEARLPWVLKGSLGGGGGVIPDRGTIRGQGAGWEEGGGGGWKKVAVEGNRKPCGQVWGLDNRDISDDFEAGVI